MTAAVDLLPGDFIQARLHGATPAHTPDQYLVTEFTVTTISGTVVSGSVIYPNGLDETAGWAFELIARPPVALPTVLSEITAVLADGSTPTLMGKGKVWADATTGEAVDHTDITSFTPNDQGATP